MEQSTSHSPKSNLPNKTDLEILDELIDDLPDAVETKIRLEHVFSSIHQKMISGLETSEILDSIFESLNRVIPFDRIGIALLENGGKDIRQIWVKSILSVSNLYFEYVTPLKETSLKEIIESGKPRIINDLEDYLLKHPDSKSTKLILQDGIRSSLTCPVIHDGTPIGVVFFSSSVPNTYAKLHVELFCEISQGLSVIIAQGLLKKNVAMIEEKERMFRDTLHDLNNPLWVIQSALQMIARKKWYKDLGEDSKKMFDLLKRNTEAMIKLVQQIVYDIKEEENNNQPATNEVPIKNFLMNMLEDAKALAIQKDIHISLDQPEELPPVLNFDQTKVKQAIENLIANAIKYNDKNSQVYIKVYLNKEMTKLHFIVSDNGTGIPEDILKKLFKEPVMNPAPSSAGPSSGRGLLNVKRIINSLGGEASVESKTGEGASFKFWVPLINSTPPNQQLH